MIDVVDSINQYSVQKELSYQKLRKPREAGRYWPSESSVVYTDEHGDIVTVGKCARAIYYSATNVPKTDPADAIGLRKMRAGNLYEDEERRLGEEAGILVKDSEYPLEFKKFADDPPRRFKYNLDENILISGEIDLLYKIDGKYYLGEMKTGYGYMFSKQIFKQNEPKPEHLMQIAIYLHVFKGKVEHGILLYEDRGECVKQQFKIELDDYGRVYVDGRQHPFVTTTAIFDRVRYVHGHISAGNPPRGDFNGAWSPDTIEDQWKKGKVFKTHYAAWKKKTRKCIGDFQCYYCDYRTKCMQEQGQAIK